MIPLAWTKMSATFGLTFWTFLLVADATQTVVDTNTPPDPLTMAALAVGIATMAGAWRQLEIFGKKEESTSWPLAICGCGFSGMAGFIAFALSRKHIYDPYLLTVEFILVGIAGQDFVKRLAKERVSKIKGNSP